MSLADAKTRELTIAGPPGLMHWLASARSCTYRFVVVTEMKDMKIETRFRDEICVDVVEATMGSADVGGPPNPIYKDDNITLYSFLIQPESRPSKNTPEQPIDPVQTSSPRQFKRKRTPSPFLSSKRAVHGESSSTDRPLVERMKHPQFNPALLSGPDAQEWRRLLVQSMFPRAEPLPEPKEIARYERKLKYETRKKQRHGSNMRETQQNSDADLTTNAPAASSNYVTTTRDQTRHHTLRPPKHDRQLPPFTGPKSVCAYVLVGPRIRGKFDAAKAQELQVPKGPVRRQLAAGQTITFKVKGPNGQMVEKTVASEEVVGKAEPPKAILILDTPDASYIPGLVTMFREWTWLRNFGKVQDNMATNPEVQVHSVFHMCGDGVVDDLRYKEFMGSLGGQDTHVSIHSRYLRAIAYRR
jgi:ribonuclease Z